MNEIKINGKIYKAKITFRNVLKIFELFKEKNPQRIEMSLKILGLPTNETNNSYLLDQVSKYIFDNENNIGKSNKVKKNFDLNYDYKYYFPDFLKYGINLNKQDLPWWEFDSILNAILIDNKSNMKRVLDYRNYERPIKNEKVKETIRHQKMMKLKQKYALPTKYDSDENFDKLWNYLEKKVGEKKYELNIQRFADGKIRYKVVLDNKKAIKSLENLEDKAEKSTKNISSIGSVGKTAFKALSLGVTTASTAMTALIGYGVKYNAEIEQLNTSFEVMTGSAEKAAEITEKLKGMGAATPFETKDLAEVTQLLMNYGLEADTAIERMSMLGDIAQGSADKMQRIAMAYGQMSSAGKVSLEDIKQMIEAGFNPLQEISETTGESMASLYDRISAGTISIDEITASMERSTSEGGKYFKSMEKQSKTLNGQISTLKDNFSSLAGVLANDVSGELSSSILPEINQLISDMESALEEDGVDAMIAVMSNGIANMLITLVEQLPEFIEVGTLIIQSLINGITSNSESLTSSIILAIFNLINAILSMLPQLLELGIQIIFQLINGISKQAPSLIPQIIDCLLLIIDTILDNLDLMVDAGINLIWALADGLLDALPDLIDKIPEIIDKLLWALSDNLPKLTSMGMKLTIELGLGLIKAIPELVKQVPEIMISLMGAFGKYISEMGEVGLDLIKGLWNGIKNAKEWLKDKIGGFFDDIVADIKDFFGINSPSKLFFSIGGYIDEGFIDGIDSMKKDISNEMDDTFGNGLDYLYNGYNNFNLSIPDTTYAESLSQTIFVNNSNNNRSTLEVDGKVLAEVVNEYNENREVAV